MSAYVVEDKTINKIVSWLEYQVRYNRGDFISAHWLKKKFSELGYDLEKKEEFARLAEDMFGLNVLAIEERYGNGEAEKFRALNFKYVWNMNNAVISMLKGLRCWIYQCSEGDVPENSKLYKLWDDLSGIIAMRIISRSPEYENADWG
ncbi:MAG: hypothetical protein ABIH85_03695 [Candidatus Omnitrophota bacterium]